MHAETFTEFYDELLAFYGHRHNQVKQDRFWKRFRNCDARTWQQACDQYMDTERSFPTPAALGEYVSRLSARDRINLIEDPILTPDDRQFAAKYLPTFHRFIRKAIGLPECEREMGAIAVDLRLSKVLKELG